MRNPIQIANELETFKRQHGGGSIIDEAVATLRRQQEELNEAEEMRHSFGMLLRWVKRVCGRRMKKIRFIHFDKRTKQTVYVSPKIAEINKYDILIRECEEQVPNSGVYGDYV